METKVTIFFNEWLKLMEQAHLSLNKKEWEELEDRIIKEIKHGRQVVTL